MNLYKIGLFPTSYPDEPEPLNLSGASDDFFPLNTCRDEITTTMTGMRATTTVYL